MRDAQFGKRPGQVPQRMGGPACLVLLYTPDEQPLLLCKILLKFVVIRLDSLDSFELEARFVRSRGSIQLEARFN
jgi:hypothetical protein